MKHFPKTNEEYCDDEVCAEGDSPSDGDYILSDSGPLGSLTSASVVGGKFIGQYRSDEDAERAVLADMDRNQFWPSVWYVSDHGNIIPRVMVA
jgi:hypothetical protein